MKSKYGLASVAACVLPIAGCVPHQLQCASQYYTEYRGIGFLLGNGVLSFEASDNCSVLVDVPAKDFQRLNEITERFPDKATIPVRIEITGRLNLHHDEMGWSRVFEADDVEKIDTNVSAKEAEQASIVAFGTRETP